MIQSSNKIKFLVRFIPKLFAKGLKVLIFSQYTMMLDVIEDCILYRGWYCYERLDGRTKGNERQKSIDRFNKIISKKIFLLSTRAGGVGLNLTAASVVVFVDSDYNPYKDIQAFSRAHRIG